MAIQRGNYMLELGKGRRKGFHDKAFRHFFIIKGKAD
jgi:hypothetical protein